MFTNITNSYAKEVEINGIYSSSSFEDRHAETLLRDRGSLKDLCAAGLKQYCPENRGKYKRPLTYREKNA